jgi:site-specific recombinase XerD
MDVREAIDEYLSAIRLKHSASTQIWLKQHLHVFADWCQEHSLALGDLKARHVNEYLGHLATRPHYLSGKPLSAETVHGRARQIRAFLNWCVKQDEEDLAIPPRIAKNIAMPKVTKKIIETLSDEHIARLFAACESEKDRFGNITLVVRARAILALLLDTGIRASELCGLTLDNLFLDPDDSYIKVLGKGSKWREVGPLGRRARAALPRYIRRYRRADRKEQHVFLTRSGTPLDKNGLGALIRRLVRVAGITDIHVSCHVAIVPIFVCALLVCLVAFAAAKALEQVAEVALMIGHGIADVIGKFRRHRVLAQGEEYAVVEEPGGQATFHQVFRPNIKYTFKGDAPQAQLPAPTVNEEPG